MPAFLCTIKIARLDSSLFTMIPEYPFPTDLDASKNDASVTGDSSAHGVHNGLGLFEDLLLHERLVVAEHNLLELHGETLDDAGLLRGNAPVVVTVDPVDGQMACVDEGDVVVLQKYHLTGVFNDCTEWGHYSLH